MAPLRLAAGLALALSMAAPVVAADVQLPTEPMSDEDIAAIDAGIAAVMEEHPEVPAFYVGFWSPERGSYQQAYGLADVAAGREASVADHFRIGSISKTFGGAVILQLVEEGLLALDDTVADVDPELAGTYPDIADIRIRDLLSMSSGIPDYMNVPDATVATHAQQPDTQWDPIDLIGFGVEQGLQPVGTYGYSTTNYVILQEIAETLTGQPIQELVTERLTEPLGMPGTAMPYNEDTTLPEPLARGYMSPACVEELVRDGAEPIPQDTDTTDWNASYGQIGGGMHSTVADLGTWAASMAGSSLLSDELAAERIADMQLLPDVGIFTYGLGISQFVEGMGVQYGHEGEAIGWEGWVGHDTDTGESFVVFTNTCSDSAALFKALAVLDPAVQPLVDLIEMSSGGDD